MRIQPIALVLVAVAVVLVIVAVIYLTKTANNLPGFIPGKPAAKELRLAICNAQKSNQPCFTPRHYTKRGIAAGGLAVVALVGAWYTSGFRKASPGSSHGGSAETSA